MAGDRSFEDRDRVDRQAEPAEREDRGVYIISVAAELVGVHPQTLRIYERKGLLRPFRTAGNTRRYSARDIRRLRTIQRLTQEGVNLAGVKMIVEMENELERMRSRMEELQAELDRAQERTLREIERVRREHRAEIVPLSEVRRFTIPVRESRSQERRRGPIPLGPGEGAGGGTKRTSEGVTKSGRTNPDELNRSARTTWT